MSDVAIEARWVGGLRFEAVGRGGVPMALDGDSADGPSPPEALLMSLGACMGVDVVDILTKMRVPLAALTVRVEGDRRADPPRRYTAVRLVYRASGVPDADRPKLERAVDLSRDRYCSVWHTLRPDLELAIGIENG